MIGIGVGIDYALFIVTRFREALASGRDPEGCCRARPRHRRSRRAVRGHHGRDRAARTARAQHPDVPRRRGRDDDRRAHHDGGGIDPAARLCSDSSVGTSTSSDSPTARCPRTRRRRSGTAGAAWCSAARGPRSSSRSSSCSCSRCRSSDSASGSATPATDRPPTPPGRPTTPCRDGFGPGFNGPLLIVTETPGGATDLPTLQELTAALERDAGRRSSRLHRNPTRPATPPSCRCSRPPHPRTNAPAISSTGSATT